MYICTPNMKFLCLTMWLGGLYSDNDNTDANKDNDRQSTIVYGSLVGKLNEPKSRLFIK